MKYITKLKWVNIDSGHLICSGFYMKCNCSGFYMNLDLSPFPLIYSITFNMLGSSLNVMCVVCKMLNQKSLINIRKSNEPSIVHCSIINQLKAHTYNQQAIQVQTNWNIDKQIVSSMENSRNQRLSVKLQILVQILENI